MGTLIGSKFLDQKAAQFNGIDEYMYKDDPSFKSNTQGCWSFWFRTDSVFSGNGNKGMITYGVRNASNDSTLAIGLRRITATGTGTYVSYISRATNGGTNRILSFTTTAIAINTWYHVAIFSDDTSIRCYVNDTLQTANVVAGSNNGDWYGDISGANHRLVTGINYVSNTVAGTYFDGRLNEAVYLNRAPSTAEITSLYNAGATGNPHRITSLGADWITWYRFGDSRDDATTVYDEKGSNNLTLVNMDASNYVTP